MLCTHVLLIGVFLLRKACSEEVDDVVESIEEQDCERNQESKARRGKKPDDNLRVVSNDGRDGGRTRTPMPATSASAGIVLLLTAQSTVDSAQSSNRQPMTGVAARLGLRIGSDLKYG